MEQEKEETNHELWDGPLTLCTTNLPPPYVPPDRIAPNLYVGCEYASVNVEQLQEDYGIGHVIVAAHEGDTHIRRPPNNNHNPISVTVLDIDDRPSEDISKYFDQVHDAYSAQQQEGKSLLIHCVSGVSRSGSLAVALLMKTYHLSYEDAVALARQGRPAISPNRGFQKQLLKYEQQLMKSSE